MLESAASDQLIYVVDDDVAISQLVAVNLAARGHRVKQFHAGRDSLASLQIDLPDLVILDLILPDSDGLDIATRIREAFQVPIVVLSVQDETAFKVAALDLGADDYMTKPFRVDELVARVRAILRRTSVAKATAPAPTASYGSGGLLVDLESMRVTIHDRQVQLTPREWATLRVLVKYVGRVVSPRQLLQ